ncbi:MAG TPA: ammonium transporter, partial [Polyangia bacterium]|nr:ammonium transporter [Polyangia bacterium]
MNGGHAEIALNLVWVLMAGFLVMFMQVGFAMVETGFTRAKNAVNTMAMNLIIYPIGVLGFWLVGYGLMQGGVVIWPSLGHRLVGAHEITLQIGGHALGLFGAARFALLTAPHDPANLTMFLFSAVFMDTAATIPTGAMAERWKFSAFIVYGLFMSMLLYPLYGNWVWGGGWLAAMGTNWGLGHGHVDFAGSSVVHMTGGLTALAGAIVLGPRLGRKFKRDGGQPMLPHDLTIAVTGGLILWFGWYGFNPGSTLSAMDFEGIGRVAANTTLAACAAGLTAMAYAYILSKKWDVSFTVNGFLAGLVAIT